MKQSVLQRLKSKWKKSSSNSTSSASSLSTNSIERLSAYSWFTCDNNREQAESFLMRHQQVGVFLVRKSETVRQAYVLSVRVPRYVNKTEVSHYLIETTAKSGLRIKGSVREFNDMASLITHCSLVRGELPVLLNVDFYNQEKKTQTSLAKMRDLLYFSSQSSLNSDQSIQVSFVNDDVFSDDAQHDAHQLITSKDNTDNKLDENNNEQQ